MCKIMIIPGIKVEHAAAAARFARAARPGLTKWNDDAFGYAALGADGNIFGERWTEVREAFRNLDTHKRAFARLRATLGSIARIPKARSGDYSSFGIKTDAVNTWLLHARRATCGKGIENAHPFVRDGHALIHNGMIHNAAALKNLTSTCDSETILNAYVDAGVAADASRLELATALLRGWYAVATLTPTDAGYVVDVFKDDTSLYAAYVVELDTTVFCTDDDVIKDAAKALGMRVHGIQKLPPGIHLRIDAVTGDLLHSGKIECLRPAMLERGKGKRGRVTINGRDVDWKHHTTESVVVDTAERASARAAEAVRAVPDDDTWSEGERDAIQRRIDAQVAREYQEDRDARLDSIIEAHGRRRRD